MLVLVYILMWGAPQCARMLVLHGRAWPKPVCLWGRGTHILREHTHTNTNTYASEASMQRARFVACTALFYDADDLPVSVFVLYVCVCVRALRITSEAAVRIKQNVQKVKVAKRHTQTHHSLQWNLAPNQGARMPTRTHKHTHECK